MSNLMEHADREMRIVGITPDADSEYGGMTYNAVMDLVRLFSEQGHSGFSAGQVIGLFGTVASFRPLTPITSDPAEWVDVSEMSGVPMWQNSRDSACFSTDGGETWYSLNERQPA